MKEFNKESLLKYIKEEIERVSAEDIEKAEKEVQNIRNSEISRMERQMKEANELVYQNQLEDLKVQHTVEMSKLKSSHMKELFVKREEYAQKVFEEVKEKLLAYTKTDAYVQKNMESMKQYLVGKNGYTLRICPNDEKLEKESKNLDGVSEVILDENIEIGGYVLSKNAQYFDETLDTKFEEQKKWFYSNSNFIID